MVVSGPKRLRLAVVGCGAISEKHHLPAALKTQQCDVTLLVDSHRARAEDLGRRFGIGQVATELSSVAAHADAAVVAVPNDLHADFACTLLEQGVHVLLEKPMALSSAQCDRILRAQQASGAVLALGHVRRFWAAPQFIKTVIDSGVLGRIRSIELRDGWEFAWPLKSLYLFQREQAGGGCLMDMGPHLIDLLIYWFGDLELISYHDDSRGGVEANCEVRLRTKDGAEGFVDFSRTRELHNTFILRFERGLIEMGSAIHNQVALTLDGVTQLVGQGLRPTNARGELAGPTDDRQTWNRAATPLWREGFDKLMLMQMQDFLEASRGEHPPLVSGEEGKRSIAFVEQCYAEKQDLEPEWQRRRREIAHER